MSFRLNEEQARAAECLDRPVLVTAGAGSGKTRMLTERYMNAVVEGSVADWDAVETDQVIAITFTEKAASEIAERVREELRARNRMMVVREGDLWISTIHGLCSRILRRHPFEAGVDPLFRVADTVAAGRLRERAFEEAARERIATDQIALRLFDLYGFGAVFSVVIGISRELAVAGLSADDIALERVLPVATLQDEADALFRAGTATCNLEYGGSSSDPVDHAERCVVHLARCSALRAGEPTETELLEGLLGTLSAYRPLKSLKGIEHVHQELLEWKSRVAADVAAALVAPLGQALGGLVMEYGTRYVALKQQAGVLDFEDLQVKAVDVLTSNPEIAAGYRERFSVVMIDEFQDTDALQLRLVKELSAGNLCTVGDDMQSIYRFRGADVDVYRRHRSEMETDDALMVELATNYRSHPDILGFVNAVFASTEYEESRPTRLLPAPDGRGPQPLDGVLTSAPRIEVLFVDTSDADTAAGLALEAKEIALRLAELVAKGAHPGDVAILLRSYTPAHVYAEALTEVGIPASVVGGSRFFGLEEIAIMRALTRVIANVHDDEALAVLLVSDFVPLSEEALLRCRLATGTGRTPLWESLCEGSGALHGADKEAAERLTWVIDAARSRLGRDPLEHVLMRAVEEAGWDMRLIAAGNMGLDAFANVLKYVRRAATFEQHEGSGPASFSAYLDAKERFGDGEAPASLVDDTSDAVRIMSIHASKGLEFPIVVVPRLASSGRNDSPIVRMSRLDASLQVALKTYSLGDMGESPECSTWFERFRLEDKAGDDQESDRVLYVALTRARDFLLVSGTANMRPKRASTARNHLVRLARVLGLQIPVEGPSDRILDFEGGVRCRVRVVQASPGSAGLEGEGAEDIEAPPPAFGPSLGSSIRPMGPPKRLSYTQLSEFEYCPRQFRIRRVLGIRPIAVAIPGHADPMRFGNALHGALQLVGREGRAPSTERISAIARYFDLDEDSMGRLAGTVAGFCASSISARINRAEAVMREAPLTLDIGSGAFLLTGSIDLYATNGESALIVDYKSGETAGYEQLQERYRLQADCYALAALRDGRRCVEVIFARPEVEREGDIETVEFAYTSEDARRIEEDLLSRYRGIESSTYPPQPGETCRNCRVPEGMCEHRSLRAGSH